MKLRGCAAIATGDVSTAERAARALDAEKAPWAAALAVALRAGGLWRTGDARAASEAYAHGATLLTAADMALYALACRYRAAQMINADLGELDAAMTALKIRSPEQLVRLLAA